MPSGANGEVVFEVDALKMPVFEEILTNSGAWKKGEIHIWPEEEKKYTGG